MSNPSNPFGGKQVPETVVKELNDRGASKPFRGDEINDWFARRSVWVKVLSRSTKCSNYKTLTSLGKAPYMRNYIGLRPYPVITGVKVGTMGSLGSMREATINMIAFTQDQLDDLEECYLIPKMSVMVVFGWSAGPREGSSIGYSPSGVTDVDTTCSIREAGPLVDGIQGRVSKYDVTFNKDGMWWEIAVKILSPSAGVMAAPVEDFTSSCECETVSSPTAGGGGGAGSGDSGEKKKVVMSGFKSVLHNLCELACKDKAGSVAIANGIGIYLPNKDRWRTTLMEDIKGLANDASRLVVEKAIDLTNWVFDSNVSNLTPNPQESLEAYLTIDQLCNTWLRYSTSQCNGVSVYGKFDNSKSGALVLPPGGFLHSSNPHKAIFPGNEPWRGASEADACVENGYVSVGKILVNCIFAYRTLEECGKDASFEDYITRILVGVNEASGNLWELSITDNGDCKVGGTPTYSIIDLQATKKVTATAININPESAILRDVNLALKLTDAMQTQALYAGVKQGMKSNACEDKKFKKEQQDYPNEADPVGCKPADPVDCTKFKDNGCEPTPPERNKFKEKLQEMYLDTERTEAMESCYAEQVKMNNGDSASATPEQCKAVIMPYDFSFTVDGIGGFEFGQMITSNLLPKRARATYVYQVTAVEHEVTLGDWKTTINTKPRLAS